MGPFTGFFFKSLFKSWSQSDGVSCESADILHVKLFLSNSHVNKQVSSSTQTVHRSKRRALYMSWPQRGSITRWSVIKSQSRPLSSFFLHVLSWSLSHFQPWRKHGGKTLSLSKQLHPIRTCKVYGTAVWLWVNPRAVLIWSRWSKGK